MSAISEPKEDPSRLFSVCQAIKRVVGVFLSGCTGSSRSQEADDETVRDATAAAACGEVEREMARGHVGQSSRSVDTDAQRWRRPRQQQPEKREDDRIDYCAHSRERVSAHQREHHPDTVGIMSVAELKAKGNVEFAARRYEAAIQHYSDAVAAVSGEADAPHVLYSNRSACYAGLKDYSKALEDAEKTIELNPSFAKGYGRKGVALHGARRYDESIAAFEQGLKLAPADAGLKKGLEEVQRAKSEGDPGASVGKMFQDPDLFGKLSRNPKTASLLADQNFVQKLQQLQRNPGNAMGAFQDPRMLQVMGVLMGIDLQAFEREASSSDLPADLEHKREEIEKQTTTSNSRATSATSGPSSKATESSSVASQTTLQAAKSEPAVPEDAEMKDDAATDANEDEEEHRAQHKVDEVAKREAEAEKAKGNALYVKRNFDPAIEHYKKAWELHKDITYLNNLGACYFEQGNFDECVKTCQTAVEEGRAMRADYKLVAKSYGRIGSAYQKQGILEQAIKHYERSLTEHRTSEILTKLREAEKTLKEQQKQAYIDPIKSEEERNRGNDLFKAGKFVEAVSAFAEAIKRNPAEPRGYTNRASALIKLAALPEALKDCEEAIKVDPAFTKAYIRKANVLHGLKEYTKALDAIQRAQEADKDGSNAKEIQLTSQKIQVSLYQQRSSETDEETLRRAQSDPEVAALLADPILQSLLRQAQDDPRHLQEAMKDTTVRGKIEKLIAAGIIKTR